jgi:carbamoyl-phosphate synthase small subunit
MRTEGRQLVLEDGTRLDGRAFGADVSVVGEVVFATGMCGFVEALTDPSFKGQILTLTYPLQGNYGVPRNGARSFESGAIQVQGLLVGTIACHPSHHASERTLHDWLAAEGIPGIEGIDTRALTQRLREHGTMRGWIVPSGLDGAALEEVKRGAHGVDESKLAELVTLPSPSEDGHGARRVLLVDAGGKRNIVRELRRRDLGVVTVPFHGDLARWVDEWRVDAVVLGNGPGDPKALGDYVAKARVLLSRALEGAFPLFGICLGHQILALAAGADTFKLPYGHRSQNQPVRDVTNGRCSITSQNHGYAVRTDSLPSDFQEWFVNLNDGTNEGLRHRTRPIRSVQFHPEAAPGPEDTRYLFDELAREILQRRARGGS